MKYMEIWSPERPNPVRRRSVRIAMANEEALRSVGQALSEEDALDEIPLSKRMEMAKSNAPLDEAVYLAMTRSNWTLKRKRRELDI
ncbi:hypothetical protein DM860_015241 [Cuscuta australis]|uniref:Uncharacterized protein n=1 Tax=Cuscuta australis TaxID=267555 RepID=A0A328D1L5_9ASTE|nr:hypothetical protein DM860_015241 [Cuscuta australis]